MTYKGKPVALTYKKMVEFIADIRNEAEWNEACALVDYAYQHEKFNWNDHETMMRLLDAKLGQLRYSGSIKW